MELKIMISVQKLKDKTSWYAETKETDCTDELN